MKEKKETYIIQNVKYEMKNTYFKIQNDDY